MNGLGRSSRRAAACLALLAGFAYAATPAAADWVEPVTAPLNGAGTSAANAPSIADLAGTAYAAIEEQTAGGGSALVVVRQSGASWQQVGGPLTTTPISGPPQIAAADGAVYVVWDQQSSGKPFDNTTGQVYVDAYAGGAWTGATKLSAPLATDAESPAIATVGGAPYVAFVQTFSVVGAHSTYVERYDAGLAAWQQVGSALTPDNQDDAYAASVGSSGGVPYVAWAEKTATFATQVDVASYAAPNWSAPAVAVPLSGNFVTNVALTSGSTGPDLAYGGVFGAIAGAVHFDGTSWSPEGGPLLDASDTLVAGPAIVDIGATPYVALVEMAADNSERTLVKGLSGGVWTPAGSALTNPLTDFASDVSLAQVGGAPAVGWLAGGCTQNAPGQNAFLALDTAGSSNTSATSCPVPPPPPSIVPTTFPVPYVGIPYSITLVASGGQQPYTWTASGPLPPGLQLAPDGVVSGTPTSAGTWPPVPITVTDLNGNSDSGTLRLTVQPAPTTTTTTTTTSTTSTSTPSGANNVGADRTVVAPFGGVTLGAATLAVSGAGPAVLQLGCPAATAGGSCHGAAALFGVTGSLPASVARTRAAVHIATAAFSIAAGKRGQVRLTLTSATRRALAAHGHLAAKLLVTSHDGGGRSKTQTFGVTLRLLARHARR